MNSKAIEGIVLTICFLTSSISAQAKEVPFLDQVNRTVQLFFNKTEFQEVCNSKTLCKQDRYNKNLYEVQYDTELYFIGFNRFGRINSISFSTEYIPDLEDRKIAFNIIEKNLGINNAKIYMTETGAGYKTRNKLSLFPSSDFFDRTSGILTTRSEAEFSIRGSEFCITLKYRAIEEVEQWHKIIENNSNLSIRLPYKNNVITIGKTKLMQLKGISPERDVIEKYVNDNLSSASAFIAKRLQFHLSKDDAEYNDTVDVDEYMTILSVHLSLKDDSKSSKEEKFKDIIDANPNLWLQAPEPKTEYDIKIDQERKSRNLFYFHENNEYFLNKMKSLGQLKAEKTDQSIEVDAYCPDFVIDFGNNQKSFDYHYDKLELELKQNNSYVKPDKNGFIK